MKDNSSTPHEDEADHKTTALKIDGADEDITEEAPVDAFYTTPVEVSFGRFANEMSFNNWSGTLYDLLSEQFAFRVGPKDGRCIVSSHTTTGRRTAQHMSGPTLLLLDHDTGETMDEIAAKYESAGLYALLWNTFSHLKTVSDVTEKALAQYLKKSPQWKSQGQTSPDLTNEETLAEQIKDYFQDVKGYVPSLCQTMHNPVRVTEGGVKFLISHEPMHKLRSLLVLAEKFDLLNAGVQDERINEWKERIAGFCQRFNVPYDNKCVDPCRLMYLPVRPKGSNEEDYEIREVAGRLVTLDDMPRFNKRTGASEANAFTAAARELRAGALDTKDAQTFVTKNLRRFMAQGGSSFAIAEWLREVADDDVRAERDNKLTVCCPNDDNHSNAGDPSDQGFWVQNAQDRDPGAGFMAMCSHTTCGTMSNNDRAWYLDALCQKYGIDDAMDLKDWCDDWKESGHPPARDLPPGFKRKNGMIYSGACDEDEDGEETQERGVVVCSDLKCVAFARDGDSNGHSRIFEFVNGEGVSKTVSVANADLQSDCVAVRANFADAGLFISTHHKAKSEFMRLLNTVHSERLERHSPKTGFMGENNEAFVLPVEVAGFGAAVFAPEASDQLKAEKHIWTKRPADFTPTSKGTLQGWQEGANIAFKSDAQGQIAAPHAAEGILRGVCGPLIALADHDPMGMHYVGASSTGKTTQGMAQVSPWSDVVEGRGLMFTAKGTVNSHEFAFEAMNHTTGVINDLENSPDPTLARELPYTAAGRGGKRRKDKNLNDRRTAKWGGLSFTMNSERSPQQLMGKHAAQTSGGLVRAPVLNTSNVPKMDKGLLDRMTGAFKDNFGHAGAHLVSGLYKRGWHRDNCEMEMLIDAYNKEHTEGLEPAQRRSLEVYAFARVAGDLMVEDGILGPDITKDDVAAVVRWAIDQVKASPEFQKMNAPKNGARQLIEFLNTSGQVYATGTRDYEGRATPLAWKDGVAGVAYVPQSSFAKVADITASETDIVAELKDRKLLIKRGADRWLHGHLPGFGPIAHYRVNLEAANKLYGGDDYAPPSAEEKAFAAAKRGDAVTVKADPLDAVAAKLRGPWRSVGSGMEVAVSKALGQFAKPRRRGKR